MVVAVQGLRTFTRSSLGFLHSGVRGCGGMRNVSLKALPTHYVLPSGDKIPSVALGMVMLIYHLTRDYDELTRDLKACGKQAKAKSVQR